MIKCVYISILKFLLLKLKVNTNLTTYLRWFGTETYKISSLSRLAFIIRFLFVSLFIIITFSQPQLYCVSLKMIDFYQCACNYDSRVSYIMNQKMNLMTVATYYNYLYYKINMRLFFSIFTYSTVIITNTNISYLNYWKSKHAWLKTIKQH